MSEVALCFVVCCTLLSGCASNQLDNVNHRFTVFKNAWFPASTAQRLQQQKDYYEQERKKLPTHLVRCDGAPTTLANAFTNDEKIQYHACHNPKLEGESRELATRWHMKWQARIDGGTYHDHESQWNSTSPFFLDLPGAWQREMASFADELTPCLYEKGEEAEHCLLRRFDWKLEESHGGVAYQTAKTRYEIDHTVPFTGCYDKGEMSNREGFLQAYCTDMAVHHAKQWIERMHVVQLQKQFETTGSNSGPYSDDHAVWAANIKQICSGMRIKSACINREIQWRLDELNGDGTASQKRIAYSEAE